MKSATYAGMGYHFPAADVCAVEGAGPIQDRTEEHLAPSDLPIAVSRRMLLEAIASVQAGSTPPYGQIDPTLNRRRQVVATYGLMATGSDWREHCRQYE